MAQSRSESPASAPSPSSTTAAHTTYGDSGTKATKDRPCPFCHQSFNSSSLGRHLDLFVRPKNPKPPDGIHDVSKIKSLRSGITRRQPRGSLKGKHERDDTSERSTPLHDTERRASDTRATPSASGSAPASARREPFHQGLGGMIHPGGSRPDENVRSLLNTTSWQATGVINNLPSLTVEDEATDPNHVPAPDMPGRNSNGLSETSGRDGDYTERPSDANVTSRAAGLALREVLESLNAAKTQVSPSPVFDFDFFGMNFPALCLHISPVSSLIHTSTPFAPAGSLSQNPPMEKEYEEAKKEMGFSIRRHVPPVREAEIQRMHTHFHHTWEFWFTLSDTERERSWRLETLRAFAKARDRVKQKDAELMQAKQQVEHLRKQYESLSNSHLPKEFRYYPTNTLFISPEVSQELEARTPESRQWDYDRLVGKWQGRIRDVQRKERSVRHLSATNRGSDRTPPPGKVYPSDYSIPDATVHQPAPANGNRSTAGVAHDTSTQRFGVRHPRFSTAMDEDTGADSDDEDAEGEVTDNYSEYVFPGASAWKNGFRRDERAPLMAAEPGAAELNEYGKRRPPASDMGHDIWEKRRRSTGRGEAM